MAIVHDLSERDANEIIVMLAKNNIKASKIKEIRNQEVFWVIQTSSSDELQARSILVANNLPRIRQGGLEGICKDTGLILTPKAERCRELLAYKGEIINSLESIPGVVSADVVLNLPEKEDFPDPNAPQPRATASVTIQYLADANVKTRLTEAKVQEFVANSITDLDPRDVAVVISYFAQRIDNDLSNNGQNGPPNDPDKTTPQNAQGDEGVIPNTVDPNAEYVSFGGMMLDAASAKKIKLIAAVLLVVLLLLAAGFIYVLLRMSRMRRQSSVPAVIEQSDSDDQKLLGS